MLFLFVFYGVVLNIRVIKYILAVDDLKNFHNAAEFCGVSQPALSTAIKSFEDYIGFKIFSRTTRKVLPTDAGKKVIAQIKVIDGELSALLELANYHSESSEQPFIISLEESVASFVLPLVNKIQQRLPEIKLHIYEEPNKSAINKLVNSLVDLAILSSADSIPSGLICEHVANEEWLLIVPSRHGLAKEKKVKGSEIASENLILLDHKVGFLGELSGSLNVQLAESHCYKTKTIQGVCMMVNAGMGVGFIPASFAGNLTGFDVAISELESKIYQKIYLAWRANEERTHSLGHVKRLFSNAGSSNGFGVEGESRIFVGS